MPKVTFDPVTKIIQVADGVTSLDVARDLYSEAKVVWRNSDLHAKFLFPFRVVGGDPLVEPKRLAPYFFLTNGWKIRPWNEDHMLTIAGNLFVDEPEKYGANPFVAVPGKSVTVTMMLTSDAIVVTVKGRETTGGLSDEERKRLYETLTLKQFLALK